MAFLKMGMLPKDFADLDMFQKALVIGFLQQYAKDKNKPKGYRKR